MYNSAKTHQYTADCLSMLTLSDTLLLINYLSAKTHQYTADSVLPQDPNLQYECFLSGTVEPTASAGVEKKQKNRNRCNFQTVNISLAFCVYFHDPACKQTNDSLNRHNS